MVVLFLSIYATQHLNFSLTRAGIIMGLFGAGSFLGVFVGGKLTDKIGGKWVMTGSLFFGGIMFLILGIYNFKFAGVNSIHFHNRFKTEADCLDYLSLIKWEGGYSCIRCFNAFYFRGKSHLINAVLNVGMMKALQQGLCLIN